MIKYVDYDKDIKEPFEDVLRGAYNKANIWPKTHKDSIGFDILREEIDEVEQAYVGFKNEVRVADPSNKVCFAPILIHGHVLSLITELLQVLAVCNKYWPCVYGGDNNDQD